MSIRWSRVLCRGIWIARTKGSGARAAHLFTARTEAAVSIPAGAAGAGLAAARAVIPDIYEHGLSRQPAKKKYRPGMPAFATRTTLNHENLY